MSNAKKCDRCKEYYDSNLEPHNDSLRLQSYGFISRASKGWSNKDLCLKCYNDLYEWFHEFDEEKQND